MMVSGEPKPLSWEIMWVGVVVPGQRDGDLLSLQTKMKPKAAGKTTSQLQGDRGLGREPEAGSYILTICF